MIETQRLGTEGKKSKLLLKKRYSQLQQATKYSCLFKQNTPQHDSSSTQPEEQDPIKIFINSVFCYRTIKSIVKKQHFIHLKLKETQNEKLSINAHINRFKNSSSKIYQNFGRYLEIIDHLMKEKSSVCNKENIGQMKVQFQNQLQQVLDKNQEKQLVIFYYEPSQKLLNFSQILISTKLLKNLGYDLNEFCDDFLKYKHLFFEIFETSLFQKAIHILAKQYRQFVEKNGEIQNMNANEICKFMKEKLEDEVTFSDCIYMREKGASGIIQKKIPANFSYLKIQANITTVQLLNFDKSNVIKSQIKRMSNVEKRLKEFEQDKVLKEIEEMKKLMHQAFPSNDKNVKQVIVQELY